MSDVELRQEIDRLKRNPTWASSDRTRDRLRTKLKKLGMVRFDRKAWRWEVLPAGEAFLSDAPRL